MKFSTIVAVTAVALTVVATGCKYDKSAEGAEGDEAANVTGIAGDEGALGGAITGEEAVDSSQEGALSGLMTGRFEDMYTKCTDVNFPPVYFGFDSTVIPAGETGKIDAVAQHLLANADRVVVVEGNCDERGSNEYNVSLGENRANIVRNYLVQSGIAGERIQTRSYGEEKPVADGHDESSWAMNRRGEFGIYKR